MLLASLLLAIVSSSPAPKPGYVDSLAEGFRNPPASAKPHTWWHWMDGNVTKEGITADLEAMKKVGIGGAQMFTVSQGIPPGPAGYMSPLWRELTTFAIKEAGRLGIELCIHNCAGWSSSGGPWVAPENAMQVVAWSERKVRGPARFSEILPPAKAPFVYASVPYYRDIAVFGFRTPAEGDAGKADPQLLGKSGVHRMDGLEPNLTPTPAGLAIPKDGLVNLTSKLEADGRLTWDVPEGDWTILRMGHVPTGKNNHPAPPEGDGLEVDKLSREALDAFWAGMMAKVIADAGPDLSVSCEEVFGPVCTVTAYDGLDDAIALANGTRYGLQAGIFTSSVKDALRAARSLDFGGVTVNEAPTFRADQMPYGGVKDSGNTREGPAWAVREMTEERLVVLEL